MKEDLELEGGWSFFHFKKDVHMGGLVKMGCEGGIQHNSLKIKLYTCSIFFQFSKIV